MRELHRLLLSTEVRDLSEEVMRLFQDLERSFGRQRQTPPGECTPPVDVLETETSANIVVDLPGVPAGAIRILAKSGVVVIAGEKLAPAGGERAEASFHLVERSFGRFARVVRLAGAFDTSRAHASLKAGELRVIVPRITERRGQEIFIRVEPQPA